MQAVCESEPVVAPKTQLLLATLPQHGEACHLPCRNESAAVRTAVVIMGGMYLRLIRGPRETSMDGSGASKGGQAAEVPDLSIEESEVPIVSMKAWTT